MAITICLGVFQKGSNTNNKRLKRANPKIPIPVLFLMILNKVMRILRSNAPRDRKIPSG